MTRLLALCLIAGCGVLSGPGADSGDDDSGPGTPRTSQLLEGHPYKMVNQIDVTVDALLPEQADRVVSTLREMSTNPAHALIEAADEAGVPAVGDLAAALPGPIQDRLEGWINDEIAKVEIDGASIPEYAARIVELADTALTRFAVDSELTVRGGTAHHQLTALDLRPTGVALTVPIGRLPGDLVTRDTSAVIVKTSLALGEQHFGLDYGEYAWQGIEAAARARYGNGIRASLGAAVNCPDLARRVAGKCVLGACVGHEVELTSICEGGLDAIVDLAHDRMAELRLEALHLASGQATLVDDDRDGFADRITAGTWQAELNLGVGLRHAPASFTGTR